MALLIDGYNLLHAAGIFGKGRGGASLQRSREAMLRFLAASIGADERPQTTVVFDAADAPPGLPRSVVVDEMSVLYAATYDDADELLEELIAAHHAPRSLLVVSSDHRIQRAARRRRCRYLDSDHWYAVTVRRRLQQGPPAVDSRKELGETSQDEVAYWVEQFTNESLDADGSNAAPRPRDATSGDAANDSPLDPFPPGYADDLFNDADGI